jgi:hypothetical protein
MTNAGMNIRFDIFRVNYGSDDEVGGAVITGTCQHHDIPGRLQGEMPNQLLLQQGLETPRTFTATIFPGTLDIRERDEVWVSEPHDHVYYHQYFRVIGVTYSNFTSRDPRSYLLLSLTRSERAHSNTLNQ